MLLPCTLRAADLAWGARTGGVAGRASLLTSLAEDGVGGLGELKALVDPVGLEGARGGILAEVGVGLPALGAATSAWA